MIDVWPPKNGSEPVCLFADSLIHVIAEHVSAQGTNGSAGWLFAGEGYDPPHQRTVGYRCAKRCATPVCLTSSFTTSGHFYAAGPNRGRVRRGDRPAITGSGEGGDNPQHTSAHLWPTAGDLRGRQRGRSCLRPPAGAPLQATSPRQRRPASTLLNRCRDVGPRTPYGARPA